MEIPEFINDFRKMRKMGGGKQMKLGILCTMINGFGRKRVRTETYPFFYGFKLYHFKFKIKRFLWMC